MRWCSGDTAGSRTSEQGRVQVGHGAGGGDVACEQCDVADLGAGKPLQLQKQRRDTTAESELAGGGERTLRAPMSRTMSSMADRVRASLGRCAMSFLHATLGTTTPPRDALVSDGCCHTATSSTKATWHTPRFGQRHSATDAQAATCVGCVGGTGLVHVDGTQSLHEPNVHAHGVLGALEPRLDADLRGTADDLRLQEHPADTPQT